VAKCPIGYIVLVMKWEHIFFSCNFYLVEGKSPDYRRTCPHQMYVITQLIGLSGCRESLPLSSFKPLQTLELFLLMNMPDNLNVTR